MNVAVFCASSFGHDPQFQKEARMLGEKIAQKKHTLIYGGSNFGLMGVTAQAALDQGGKVIGIEPEIFSTPDIITPHLTEIVIVPTMSERKSEMIERADCFIALPGGIGTLDEISDVMTLISIGILEKKLFLLNIHGFYNPLLALLRHIQNEGLMQPVDESKIILVDSVEGLPL